jgi:hypothetical protein
MRPAPDRPKQDSAPLGRSAAAQRQAWGLR